MSTRSFGHRERSGSALSLRGNRISVDATSSLSRLPRGLARVPASVQRRELRQIQRRELFNTVLVHRQILERRERRPERLGRGQALERAIVALGGALEAAQPMVNKFNNQIAVAPRRLRSNGGVPKRQSCKTWSPKPVTLGYRA